MVYLTGRLASWQLNGAISLSNTLASFLGRAGKRLRAWFLINRAVRCARRHRYDRVIGLSTRAIELSPESPLAYAVRANAWSAKGEFARALDDSDEALRRKPDLPLAYNARGLVRLASGELGQALTDFSEAVRLAPRAAIFLANRGTVRRHLNDISGALDDLLKAMQMDYASLGAFRIELAHCYASLGDNERALYQLRIGIRSGAANSATYLLRAMIFQQQGDYLAAAQDFDVAVRLGPENANKYVHRAVNSLRLGRHREALADADRVWQLAPSVDALLLRADASAAEGDLAKAIVELDEAVCFDPSSAAAYGNRGLMHLKAGNANQALADIERSAELAPTCAVSYNNRGFVRQARGEHELAIADYEKAIELDPQHPNAYKNLALLRATSSVPRHRNGEEAVALAERALELCHWSEPAWCEILANAYAEAGDIQLAREWLQRASERPPLAKAPAVHDELPGQFTLRGLWFSVTVIGLMLGISQWLHLEELALDPTDVPVGIIEPMTSVAFIVAAIMFLRRRIRTSDHPRRVFYTGAVCAVALGLCLFAWSSVSQCLPYWSRWLLPTAQKWSALSRAISGDLAIVLLLYAPLGGAIGVAIDWLAARLWR